MSNSKKELSIMNSLFINTNPFALDPHFRFKSRECRVRIKRHVAVQIDHLTKKLNFKTNGQTIEWLLHQAEPAIVNATGHGLIRFPGISPPELPSNMPRADPVGNSKNPANSSTPTARLSDMVVSGGRHVSLINRSSMSRGSIDRSFAKRSFDDRGSVPESSVTLYGSSSIVPIGPSDMSLMPYMKRHASGKGIAISSIPLGTSGVTIAEYSSHEKHSVSKNPVSLYNPPRVHLGSSDISCSNPASNGVSFPMLPYYEKTNDAGTSENVYSPSSKAQVSSDMSFSIPLNTKQENTPGKDAKSCVDQHGNASGSIANACADQQGYVLGKNADPKNTSSDIPYTEQEKVPGNNIDDPEIPLGPLDMIYDMPIDAEHGIVSGNSYNFNNPYDVPFGSPDYSLTMPSSYGQENISESTGMNLYNSSVPLGSWETDASVFGNNLSATQYPEFVEFGEQPSADWQAMMLEPKT